MGGGVKFFLTNIDNKFDNYLKKKISFNTNKNPPTSKM